VIVAEGKALFLDRDGGLGHIVRVADAATRPVTQANFLAADLAGAVGWLIARGA